MKVEFDKVFLGRFGDDIWETGNYNVITDTVERATLRLPLGTDLDYVGTWLESKFKGRREPPVLSSVDVIRNTLSPVPLDVTSIRLRFNPQTNSVEMKNMKRELRKMIEENQLSPFEWKQLRHDYTTTPPTSTVVV